MKKFQKALALGLAAGLMVTALADSAEARKKAPGSGNANQLNGTIKFTLTEGAVENFTLDTEGDQEIHIGGDLNSSNLTFFVDSPNGQNDRYFHLPFTVIDTSASIGIIYNGGIDNDYYDKYVVSVDYDLSLNLSELQRSLASDRWYYDEPNQLSEKITALLMPNANWDTFFDFLEQKDFLKQGKEDFFPSFSLSCDSTTQNINPQPNYHGGESINLCGAATKINLDNGVINEPDPEPDPKPVPEPSTILGLLTFGVLGAGSLFKRHRK
jgi:hypothetical protein